MSEWRELTWDDAMRRGYEALSSGEALYEEIDAEQGRSNIDIEKHLRRAELKLAQAHAWLAMARELAWQRDDYAGAAVRSTGHQRLPYLSRLCSCMASVIAHLTRVRPEAEGASDPDRPGPGRIRAIPPHRSRDVHMRCLAASDA